MEIRNYRIIWPTYVDANKSRKEGRRVSLKYAVEKPKISEIELALKDMGFQFETFLDKSYPRCWWEKGCIKVFNVSEKKIELLKKICITIKKSRDKKNY